MGLRPTENLYIKHASVTFLPSQTAIWYRIPCEKEKRKKGRKEEEERRKVMATLDESPAAKKWLPLEANPDVMNQVSPSISKYTLFGY